LDCDMDARFEFFQTMRRKAEFFKLQVESVSKVGVQMLDLHVYKGPRWEKTQILDTSIYFKAGSIATPLCHTSYHPASIHVSWPNERRKHFTRLSTRRVDARKTINEFNEWLRSRCPEHPGLHVAKPPQIARRNAKPRTHIVIPFHKCWESAGLNRLLEQISEEYSDLLQSQNISRNLYSVGVSWSLADNHFFRKLKALNFIGSDRGR